MHEKSRRDIFAVSKGGVESCLVLKKREITDGRDIDLDHSKLARLIRTVSNDGDRFS